MKLQINHHASKRLADANLPDVLSVKEVRGILGIGRVGVYQLIEAGELTAFQMGRTYKIPKQAMEHFLGTWEGDRK